MCSLCQILYTYFLSFLGGEGRVYVYVHAVLYIFLRKSIFWSRSYLDYVCSGFLMMSIDDFDCVAIPLHKESISIFFLSVVFFLWLCPFPFFSDEFSNGLVVFVSFDLSVRCLVCCLLLVSTFLAFQRPCSVQSATRLVPSRENLRWSRSVNSVLSHPRPPSPSTQITLDLLTAAQSAQLQFHFVHEFVYTSLILMKATH